MLMLMLIYLPRQSLALSALDQPPGGRDQWDRLHVPEHWHWDEDHWHYIHPHDMRVGVMMGMMMEIMMQMMIRGLPQLPCNWVHTKSIFGPSL